MPRVNYNECMLLKLFAKHSLSFAFSVRNAEHCTQKCMKTAAMVTMLYTCIYYSESTTHCFQA